MENVDFMTVLHKSKKRDYLARVNDKDFPKPQKLRNMKFKKYPFWRIDKSNLQIINGGWHFSFLQTPENIAKKILLSFVQI